MTTVSNVGPGTRIVLDALRYLDARCDGAQEQDGMGFNKPDSFRGKQLANRPFLTVEEAGEALGMLRKYATSQLKNAGIFLPEPPKLMAEAKEAEEKSGSIRLWHDTHFLVSFPYNKRFVDAVKTIKGARWDGVNRVWMLPLSGGKEALALFPGFQVSPEDRKVAESWQPSPYRGKMALVKTQIAVSFEYDADLVAAVKTVKSARFDGEKKLWKVALEDYDALVKALPDFEISDDLKAELMRRASAAAEVARKEQALGAAVADKLDAVLDAPLPDGRKLYKHQKEAVRFILSKRRTILSDDLGLGKTVESLVSAKALGLPIYVVCPKSLLGNWAKEAAGAGVELAGVYSSAKIPEPPNHDFTLIADEAHQFCNIKAQRTQKFLAWTLSDHCLAAIPATGTPMPNGRPVNLFPLLKAVRHSLAKDKRQYELYFCAAHATRFTQWDVSGAAHLDELHEKTKDVLLRRTKAECLDLPEKTRVIRPVELSASAQKVYDERFEALRAEYEARIAKGEITDQAEAIVMLNHVYHAGSIAKVESALELAQEVLAQGQQVVVFTEFVESGTKIANTLKVKLLHGDTSADERTAMVERFQKGQDKAFVGTIKAGGVGITLTAAQTVILVDRPWTPGMAVQSEDRLHRLTQKNAVTAIWLQLGDADVERDELLQQKQERIDLVLQGKRKTLKGTGHPGDMAQQILSDIFEK